MSKAVLAAFLVVTKSSRVGPPPLQVFVGARVAEIAVLHRATAVLGPAALCGSSCCQIVPGAQCA